MGAISDVVASVLDSPVAFHRVLANLSGSAASGLMLSQSLYWTRVKVRTEPASRGWFYKSQCEWTEELCLSRWEQESARKLLRRFSFWEEDRRGVPAKLFFRVDLENLASAIQRHAQNVGKPHSRMRKASMLRTDKQVSGKAAIIKSSETSSEITVAARNNPAKHIEASVENSEQQSISMKSVAEKMHPVPSWVRGELAESLYRGVHSQKIAATFYDSKSLSAEEQLADCIRAAVTTLVTNRVAALKRLDTGRVERLSFDELRNGLETLRNVKNFEDRKRETVRAVTRVVVQTCIRLLEVAA